MARLMGGLKFQGQSVEGITEFLTTLATVPRGVRNRSLKRLAAELLEKSLRLAPDAGPDDKSGEGESKSKSRDAARGYVKLKESATMYRRKGTWIVRYATRHAAAQHERLDYQRTTGQAKYLEQPLMDIRANYRERLMVYINDELQRAAARAKRKADRESRRAGRGAA